MTGSGSAPAAPPGIEGEVKFRLGDDSRAEGFDAALSAHGFRFEEDFTRDESHYRGPGLGPRGQLCLVHEHGGADDFADLLVWNGEVVEGAGLREHAQIGVSVGPDVLDILIALGYSVGLRVHMRTRSYRRERLQAFVDHVDGLGAFLRLQLTGHVPAFLVLKTAEELANSETREGILAEGRSLGLPDTCVEPRTYLAMIQQRRGAGGP